MTASIRIEGMERIQKKLDSMANQAYMEGAMTAAVTIIHTDIAQYPDATEANNPANKRWYERGYGSRYRRKDGSIGGKRTSQTLGRRWTKAVQNRGTRGVVGNNATYAPYVQDAERQAAAHTAHGWDTIQAVVGRQKGRVVQLLQAAIHKVLNQ